MKTLAYFNDTERCYHWGCAGTSGTIKEILAERGYALTCVPHHQIAQCSQPPETLQELANPAPQFLESSRPLIDIIRAHEYLVINGEGTPHGFSSPPRTLLCLMYLAKAMGKNVQIINHSCYPNDHQHLPDSPASQLYRDVYAQIDYVAVREHITHARLGDMGVKATLAFDCLPLYIARHYAALPPSAKTRHIILATSSALRAEGLGAIVSYLHGMMAQGYTPVALSGAAAEPAVDELMFVKMLSAQLPELTHVVAQTMTEWLQYLQSAAILVSGRFHYTIAAAAMGTPCVVFDANTPKNIALSEDVGLPPPLSYTAPNLENILHARTQAALALPPDGARLSALWGERAMKNFAQL